MLIQLFEKYYSAFLENGKSETLASPTTTLGNSTLTLGATTTDIGGLTSLVVDDITTNGQTISTIASNKDIVLSPHGTGTVRVPSAYKDRAGFDSDSLTTKAYVDEVATGLDVKDSVLVSTTVNLTATYSNGTAGDGITLAGGNRILVKDETVGNRERNGVYTVTQIGSVSTNWVLTRAADTDQPAELTGGSFVFVESGTSNGGNGFVFTHVGQPTLGTTELPVSQFSGAGQIDAGDAIVKAGNRLDVNTDNSSIEVNADALRVKALGITSAMLAGSIDGVKIEQFVFTDESSTQGGTTIGTPMEFLAGAGINTVASGQTLTIAGELASSSNIGVASFTSSNFTVTSGDVAITTVDGGSF